ncbi:MAG: hypothetical protein IT306_29210 [Chloroflexi bacterium]|nr:hypothetical protein [Chloroflexota bacterium]
MNTVDALKVLLVFANGLAAFVAAYPGTDLDPMARLACGAVAAGCGAALLLMTPPGKAERFSAKQVDQLTDALLKKSGKAQSHG